MCDCKQRHGKFEGEPAVTWLAHLALGHGWSDEEIGRYTFFKAPLGFDTLPRVHEEAAAEGWCPECIEEALGTACYGIVAWEDDAGFAYSRVLGDAMEYDDQRVAALDESEEE